MTCAWCGVAILGSLVRRRYHRVCRDKRRGRRFAAQKTAQRIEAKFQAALMAQRQARRTAA